MIDALSSIEITDADIEEIERLFGDVKFDDERRQILKHMESTDIQAFPGSGKTTVLVAKLAILAAGILLHLANHWLGIIDAHAHSHVLRIRQIAWNHG